MPDFQWVSPIRGLVVNDDLDFSVGLEGGVEWRVPTGPDHILLQSNEATSPPPADMVDWYNASTVLAGTVHGSRQTSERDVGKAIMSYLIANTLRLSVAP